MAEMDFLTFKGLVEGADAPRDWRKGQTAFNGLHDLRPDLSGRIRGNHIALDPFYRDENLPAFWTWVEENWEVKS